jgi:IMP dehydrogenase/GMP reductase
MVIIILQIRHQKPYHAVHGFLMSSYLRTRFTDRFAHLNLRYPIVCAPMAGVTGAHLAAEVALGGALGFIAVGMTTVAREIARF